ncbi:MAG: recombinase family protein [Lachnospiraceae bacterium]|nr:recombinase family protein [Lachnospiraceae bacterium]
MIAKKDTRGDLAVVYARYSSHNQGEQSIEGQLAAAQKYAEAKGYTIVHEYIDRAMTGRNDNRDEFQKMLSDCSKKQFQVIILWKVDRFGRNREEITFNKYRAKKNGVRVEYVAENVPDAPEGVILESVLEGMAEYYSLQLSQNVKRGLLESAKKHHVIGGHLPLGYNMGKDKEFVIDPDTAPTVKLIFDMYAEGNTVSEIITQLNDEGYRTKMGKPFTKNSLSVVLKNEKYIGVYEYKDLIRDEDAVPPIVDKDTFYKVQEMLKINRRAPSRKWNYTDYLLTDKLFCGLCESSMVGESGFGKMGVKYNYYMCTKRRREKACDKKPVRQDWIEGIVLEEIQKILYNDELLEFIAENTWQFYLEQDTDQEQIRLLQKQLADVDKSISNLVRSIEAGIFNDVIKSRMDELDGQKVALKKALADKELDRGFKLTKEHILFFLEDLKKLNIKDRSCQRRLVEIFVNAIFVFDDSLKIAFNFGGDNSTITLQNLKDAESGAGFVRCALSPALALTYEPKIIWFLNVFAMNVKLPER